MGKNLWNGDEDEERLQSTHPGCMWGVIHALNYHHWNYNVKKMVFSQSHNWTRRGKGNGRRKKVSNVKDADDEEKLLDIDQSTANAKTCSTNRKSLRARMKALISDDMSKEESCRQKGSFPPIKSQMRRTYSIHYLDPSVLGPVGEGNAESNDLQDEGQEKSSVNSVLGDESFRYGTDDDANKLLSKNRTVTSDKYEEATESPENKRDIKANQHSRDKYKCKEHADVLELFRVNQDMFFEYLQSTDSGVGDHLHNFQTSNKLTRLTKSGSFPAADVSRSRNLRPSKLKNKQEETWPFLREEKLFPGTRAENLLSFRFLKDLSTKSGPIDASAYDLNKTLSKHRRTLSLNESMERYAQLLETGFSREPNLHQSKSLKLAKEYEISSVGGHAPVSFKRVRSLPHADSNWTFQSGPFCDAYVSGVSGVTIEDVSQIVDGDAHSVSKSTVLPTIAEAEIEALKPAVDRSYGSLEVSTTTVLDLAEKSDEQSIDESNLEEKVTLVDMAIDNLVQPSEALVNQSCSEEDIINHADYPTSEDLEHECTHIDANELSNDSQMFISVDLDDKSFKIQGHVESYSDDTDGFNFVREILEQSSFQGNSFLEPWHSEDQPLNPLVFEEVEASWPHEEPQCSGGKVHLNCEHHLLFDLINEVLVQIYDGSFTYYPKALSSNCHLRPLPSGHHFIDEVWTRISKIKSLKPEVDESVAYDFPKDLGKDDGWMNLQFETECVALELEDWIFDELLEEVLCS